MLQFHHVLIRNTTRPLPQSSFETLLLSFRQSLRRFQEWGLRMKSWDVIATSNSGKASFDRCSEFFFLDGVDDEVGTAAVDC